MGAWIEITLGPMKTEYRTLSLLSWERGLKYTCVNLFLLGGNASLLSWERGLKLMDDETREKVHRRSSRGSVD